MTRRSALAAIGSAMLAMIAPKPRVPGPMMSINGGSWIPLMNVGWGNGYECRHVAIPYSNLSSGDLEWVISYDLTPAARRAFRG
jgi:hypothetical protein